MYLLLLVDVGRPREGGIGHTNVIFITRVESGCGRVETELCVGALTNPPQDVAEMLPLSDVVQRSRNQSPRPIPTYEPNVRTDYHKHEQRHTLLNSVDQFGIADDLSPDLLARSSVGRNVILIVVEGVERDIIAFEFDGEHLISPMRLAVDRGIFGSVECGVDLLLFSIEGDGIRTLPALGKLESGDEVVEIDCLGLKSGDQHID